MGAAQVRVFVLRQDAQSGQVPDSGSGVNICEECVSLCVSILADKGVDLPPPYLEP
jgi:hypothetical protein